MRSVSGKTPNTPARRWDRLSEKEKTASTNFVKDAISMCGLAGFSWTKTHEYLLVAAELPLHPDHILNPDEPISSETSPAQSASSSRRPSTSHLLTPDAASTLTGSRPSSSTASTMSMSSSTGANISDHKQVLTTLRLLFEDMQQQRDAIYMRYINMPNNNLRKMHAHAVAQHRAAVLRLERSSLMDAIEFDKKAEKSRNMEMAVAKLRFEMELDVEASLPGDDSRLDGQVLGDVKKAEESDRLAALGLNSIHTSRSTLSFASAQSSGAYSQREVSDMRREASGNNRISGVPTIVTTVSDVVPLHLRHSSVASSLDRPASPASAKSDGHVQHRDTWKRLQEVRHKFSRKSRSRVDGVPHPGTAQNLDDEGFFSARLA